MESNHSVKKFDQIKGTSDDQISGLGQAKSYACTFCKRGFSNAQALGGHMNIHRRDRARIFRQYSEDQDQNQRSSDEAKGSSTSVHHDPPGGSNSEEKNLSQLMERKGINMTPRKPSHPFAATSEDHEVLVRSEGKMNTLEDIEEQLQLPFLLEEPVSASKKLAGCTNIVGGVTELDLELRLGPEPLDSNLSTR